MEATPEKQRAFNYDRSTRFAIRRAANFPKGLGVTRATLKSVLKAIDDYGFKVGCFASIKTLAMEADVSERTLRNALKILLELGVVSRERRGHGDDRTSLSITWNVLATFGYQAADSANQTANSGNQTANSAPSLPAEAGLKPTVNRPRCPPLADADQAATWEGAAETLRALGFRAVKSITDGARGRGDRPSQFLAALEHATQTARLPANASRLKDPHAAIAWHLENGTWPADGIVTLEQTAARRAALGARDAQERDQAAQRQRQEAADRETAELLERQHGAILDALGDAALARLVDVASRGSDFYAERLRKNWRDPGGCRNDLLAALEATERKQAET